MRAGIMAEPGATLGDIGHAIQTVAHREHFSIVREYCGHGIGQIYHDEPQVLHYGRPGEGLVLQPGMMFTIEPMINAGKPATRQMPDGWTVVTKDRSLSAQWEHMVVVTDTGYEVLTPWPDGFGDYPPIPRQLPRQQVGSAVADGGGHDGVSAVLAASLPRQDGSVQRTGCHRLHALPAGVPPTGSVQPGRPFSEQIALAARCAVLALGADAAQTGYLQTAQTLPCRPPRPCPSCCCRCPPGAGRPHAAPVADERRRVRAP